MIDNGRDETPRLPPLPDRLPEDAVVERVRTLAHQALRARGPAAARGRDAFLSVVVGGLAAAYLGWAITFASALYQ
ncbi:MAG: hypothetical protein ABUS79_07510 [Pseudomonadota bacterium]